MESILLKIRDNYPAMGHSEKHIADWITKNFEEMLGLSISQLAEKCSGR